MKHPLLKKSSRYALIMLLLCCGYHQAQAQCGVTINTSITHVACYNGTSGGITVTASGGTAPYQYQLAEAGAGAWQSGNAFNGLSAGVKPVSVKDANGCISTIYVTINQPSAALTVTSFVGNDASCNNGNNGSITISVGGGTTPYSYAWTKDGSAFSSFANLSNLAPANYKLIVTDANGCTASPTILSQEKKISCTGYTADVIADATLNTTATSVTSTTFDATAGGCVLYAQGYSSNGTAYTNGLPANGQFTSTAGTNFQMPAYNANNSLRLDPGVSGTLTLAPQFQSPYTTLHILAASGSGGPLVSYTVNFAGGSTKTGSFTSEDWYCSGCASYAVNNLSRATRSTSAKDASNTFAIREYPIAFTVAEQDKTVTSINFSVASGATGIANIMGMTGNTSTISGIRVNDGPIGSSVTPVVAITSTALSNTFCSGQSVTFTATPTYGGTAPTYQWKLNGANIAGATGATYTTNTLTNGQQISVAMTSNLTCVTTSTVTSNVMTMVLGTPAASVTVSATSTNICSGTSVTFTAIPVNEGSAPTYQWKINGSNVPGATAATFTSTTLANSDQVTVTMTSSISCATNNPATSAATTMTVGTSATPTVTITSVPAKPGNNYPATFSSAITFGGSTPTYQWYKNGVIIAGATSSTLSVGTCVTGDVYGLKLTSNYNCKLAPSAMSNYINVNATLLPISISSFNGTKVNNGIQLNWRTAQEINAKEFVIERSTDGSNYSAIGTVAASGNTNGSSYTFTDAQALTGTFYYRLKMIDLTAASRYSNVISFSAKGRLQVMDNPFKDVLSVMLPQYTGPVSFKLIEISGKVVYNKTISPNNQSLVKLDVSNTIAPGLYILDALINGEHYAMKVIKE